MRLVEQQIIQAEESENSMKKTAQETNTNDGKNRASIEKQIWDQRQLISTLFKARDKVKTLSFITKKLRAQIKELERKMRGESEENEEIPLTPQGRRQSILNELINTERDYVDDLEIIVKVRVTCCVTA